MLLPADYQKMYNKAISRLIDLYDKLGTYQAVADELGHNLSKSYVHQVIAKGYRPTSGKLVRALGLPEIEYVPMILCPDCGEPQIGDKCGCKNKTIPKMKKSRRKDYRKRIRIDIDPDINPVILEKIRNMDIEERTAALRAFALTQNKRNTDE